MTVDYTNCAQSTGTDVEICISKFLIRLGHRKTRVQPEIIENCSKGVKMDEDIPK